MTKKIAIAGIMIAQALVLSFFERMIPVTFALPGMKLGLANIVTLAAIFIIGPIPAFMIQIGRILLAGLMFGSGVSIFYSLSGGILSVLVMILLYKIDKPKISVIGISVIGACFHNIGQIIAATVIVKDLSVSYYLPILLLTAVITGLLVGITGRYLIKALYRFNIKRNKEEIDIDRIC